MKYSLLYRLWHWLMAFSVIGLLFTVLLRKTFLSYKANALIIQDKLATLDLDITIESAKMIAKAIRAPMWEWHYIFASFLVLSLVIRLYMLVRRFDLPPLLAFIRADKVDRPKKLVYFFLYLMLVVMTVSGGVLFFYEDLGLVKDQIRWIKELHEVMMYAVVLFIGMHLSGVFVHEISTKEGIVSKMIHGENEKSD